MKMSERAKFEAWLRERGVWWDPRIRLVAPSDADASAIAHGWGVIAVAPVRRGEVVFKIPRKACFGARAGAGAADEVDSQAALVRLLLRERALGGRSAWAPFLRTLPDDVPTPWRWTEAEQDWLRGTELERPLAHKLERLEGEYVRALQAGELGAPSAPSASFDEWSAGCACVISHVNPWWGGCIAPFACMLNAPDLARGQAAGVAYELSPDGKALVGVALEPLAAGAEVTQGYGDEAGAADLIYRYGFCFEQPPAGWPAGAPRPADVVSVTARHLRDAAVAIARGGWLEATGAAAAGGGKRGRGEAGSAVEACMRANARALLDADAHPDAFDERVALLARASVLQPSPWDGLAAREAERSIELGRAADDVGMLASRARGTAPRAWPEPPPGLAELLVACTVILGLGTREWARVRAHVAAREQHAPWRALGLDATDCVALALAAALHALGAGEWPPPARLESALASRLSLARAQAASSGAGGDGGDEDDNDDGDDGDGDDDDDDDDDDEPLWEVLAPSAPSSAALGDGFAFASELAVRAAQAVVERARFRKYRTIPRVGAEEPSHPLVPTMVETLHALELSILHGCSLVLDFHAQRLAPRAGGDERAAGARPAIDDPCAAWRRLPVPYPR